MLTLDFYKIIDKELGEILVKYKDDPFLKKHRTAINNQKSYALLIWFLEFYGKIFNYVDYITDGDNDSSCDVIFDNTDKFGNKIFYVVQSKWNNEKNSQTEADRDEILKALNDFDTLIRGRKTELNPKVKTKFSELDNHLKSNGEVKFVFLTLAIYRGNADDNITSFTEQDDKIKFEVIDINRIKSDYIDRKYKRIEPINPLENYQSPEEDPVNIEIVQNNGVIKIEKPFEAYTLLLRPKSIYNLFDKYGFYLFHKNVRNPLLQSKFNAEIENTIQNNPAYFWYYNNGITAITYFLPTIGKKAEKIDLTGLQIINGAQTVYAIYRAYKAATPAKRIQMDNEAFITFRLLKSGGKDFDLNVTRYTNSQNPVNDRDFYANDDIQIALQNASYQTNFWYAKRRGEFRELPENIQEVSNDVFANVYLAFHLQDPVSVLKNNQYYKETGKNLNFISHKDHKDGKYEVIFNQNTKFEDMLCSYYIFLVMNQNSLINYERSLSSSFYHMLALFRVLFIKYLNDKYNNDVNITNYLVKKYESDDISIIIKSFIFLSNFIENELEVSENTDHTNERIFKFLFTTAHYEIMKDKIEQLKITHNEIDSIILEQVQSIETPIQVH